jgi:hypothetical protein
MRTVLLALGAAGLLASGCELESTTDDTLPGGLAADMETMTVADRLGQYTTVRLTTDADLTDNEREMIGLLIEAADEMDEVFWMQASGPRDEMIAGLSDEERRFVEINYGPHDRLAGDEPFLTSAQTKPMGANFYPADMTKAEFEEAAAADPSLASLYTLVRRDSSGALVAVPYHEAFAEQHQAAAAKIREAAALADDPGLRNYLTLRADALLSGDYQPSDMAWMDMKDNHIDFVVGPIETYEDQMFGYKAAHEAYVLVKDREWSDRLTRYAAMLPELQRGLPVDDAYKTEEPGSDADLGAYDAVYYAGDANAGSKTIAINLPNDEEVQLQKGSRRLQLKNAMRAKFDEILVPIAGELIVPEQRDNVTFDAFFANTMFHEVAHGLGIKETVDGSGTVREALRDQASALEEGKADVLGLYMVTQLDERGELDTELEENMTTFVASIFRSIRFGASSAHGVANLVRFNYFLENGAIERTEDGQYRVDYERLPEVASDLSRQILTFQGDGDYDGVRAFVNQYGVIQPQLQQDIDGLSAAGIPVDVIFEQGPDVLGL